jgi:cardiolipin synthase
VRVPAVLKLFYFASKINSRNHRKVCLIDKNIVYLGSINIAQCHLSEKNGGKNWRDTCVRLENAYANNLMAAFEAAWTHTPIQERIREFFKTVQRNPTFRLNNTWQRRRILQKNLLTRVRKATQRIWITNAYFVPDNFLLKALKELAEKKIDVKILIPKKSDVLFMPWASATFYENLLRSGARIFEYLPSMLHAKTIIIDDWYLVGSSNLNHRSLLHDLEVDINMTSSEVKTALEKQFLIDMSQSKEVTYENWYKRNGFKRAIGRLLLYVKYWI